MWEYRKYKLLRMFHLISKKKYKKKTAKYTAEYRAIAKSKLFDAKWYLKHNPDVKEAGIDPILHYLECGWKDAGRECTPYFDGNQYIKMYPDVLEAGVNPLVHWELSGKKENRYADIKAHGFGRKIHQALLYPMVVYEEYQILSAEYERLKNK